MFFTYRLLFFYLKLQTKTYDLLEFEIIRVSCILENLEERSMVCVYESNLDTLSQDIYN